MDPSPGKFSRAGRTLPGLLLFSVTGERWLNFHGRGWARIIEGGEPEERNTYSADTIQNTRKRNKARAEI